MRYWPVYIPWLPCGLGNGRTNEMLGAVHMMLSAVQLVIFAEFFFLAIVP